MSTMDSQLLTLSAICTRDLAPRTRLPRAEGETSLAGRIAVVVEELATGLDINPQTVGYLERGEYNPSLHLAFRIAEYFDLPIEAIFSRAPFGRMSEKLYGHGERSGPGAAVGGSQHAGEPAELKGECVEQDLHAGHSAVSAPGWQTLHSSTLTSSLWAEWQSVQPA